MVRIEQLGERPIELQGWDFTWNDDPKNGQKVLMCGPIRIGGVTYGMLEAAGPDSPLTISVDWSGIAQFIRSNP